MILDLVNALFKDDWLIHYEVPEALIEQVTVGVDPSCGGDEVGTWLARCSEPGAASKMIYTVSLSGYVAFCSCVADAVISADKRIIPRHEFSALRALLIKTPGVGPL